MKNLIKKTMRKNKKKTNKTLRKIYKKKRKSKNKIKEKYNKTEKRVNKGKKRKNKKTKKNKQKGGSLISHVGDNDFFNWLIYSFQAFFNAFFGTENTVINPSIMVGQFA